MEALVSIRDVLSVRKKDFFVSYGMGPLARSIVDNMRTVADVSSGIALDQVQFEESSNIRTVIYRGFNECGAKQIFDKVYCNFSEFPRSLKDLKRAFNVCYDLCADNGMVLLAGIDGRDTVKPLLGAKHINKYWFISERSTGCDLLFKKEQTDV